MGDVQKSPPGDPQLELTMMSMGEAEQKLWELQEIRPKNKEIKAKISQQKTLVNKIYAANKKRIAEFEKTNYGYVALVRSTNNYYKIFGNSALYYALDIAQKLNISAKLQEDHDYTARSSEGFVSIRNIDEFTEILAKLKIKKAKLKDRTGDFFFFKLPWEYTDKQLAELVEQNRSKMQSFNHVVMVDNTIPVLFLQAEELLKAVYENVRGMSGPVERETFGYQTVNAASKIIRLYLDLANGHLDKMTCLKQIKTCLRTVKYQTKIITDMRIWTPKTCARIGEIVIKVQDITERELKNI